MSTIGRVFRVTTFGESHGVSVGCIVDGVPPRMELCEADIQPSLDRRRPGQSRLTTARREADTCRILSGVERGVTLGTPVAISVGNRDVKPGDYASMADTPRPGHADYTYQAKYGVRAASGGGRSSARETVGRVAAGAIADKWLALSLGCRVVAWVSSVGDVALPPDAVSAAWTREDVDKLGRLRLLRGWQCPSHAVAPAGAPGAGGGEGGGSGGAATGDISVKAHEAAFVAAGAAECAACAAMPAYVSDAAGCVQVLTRRGDVLDSAQVAAAASAARTKPSLDGDELVSVRCPHPPTAARMATLIREVAAAGDSVGGVISCRATRVPPGLGEPCFDKLEAQLAHAMMSLPATKGFEIGTGFGGTRWRGSQHNDAFVPTADSGAAAVRHVMLSTRTNNAGGTLGGITSGEDIWFRVAIKPVSTISREQHTATFGGAPTVLAARGRHDACVLPRAPPLIEAMAAIVLADAAMVQMARARAAATPAPLEAITTLAAPAGGAMGAAGGVGVAPGQDKEAASSSAAKRRRVD